jgi:hypothetical protein
MQPTDCLASPAMTGQAMRFLLLLPLLAVAACARVATQTPAPAPAPAVPAQPRESGVLIGLTGNELVSRFGNPALQIREGNSFKIQFRGPLCVLDAFLYPSTGAQFRVTHVETRSRSGTATNQADCIRMLEYPG